MKPIIGVTCSYDNEKDRYYLSQAYIKTIEAAGGIPIIFSNLNAGDIQALSKQVDGFLFTGGDDVDPFYFGEEPSLGNGEITPGRDIFELELARLVLCGLKPVLALCRGIQVLNIAAGGTIFQDIYSQWTKPLQHIQKAPRWHPIHKINIKPEAKLAQLLDTVEVRVNSFHHQAVDQVAPGFIVSATASDGVIEGIENPEHPFMIGVQCHPEWLWEKDSRFLGLFTSFVKEAKRGG